MKEIIYIQAGRISNYIGTHFWNTQQCYFDSDEIRVDSDVSFREGSAPNGDATYCPRVVIIDRKANFGSLARNEGLYADLTEEKNENIESSWPGVVDDIVQDAVPKSAYQDQIDKEIVEDDDQLYESLEKNEQGRPVLAPKEIRFWSDYNRVYYHPRSIHKLPDVTHAEIDREDWHTGNNLFQQFESENYLVENSIRLFAEECDSFQGVSITADSNLGSFSTSLLTSLRDDFTKSPIICTPILSEAKSLYSGANNITDCRKVMNDARFIHALYNLDATIIPLENPDQWNTSLFSDDLNLTPQCIYECSAILSTHIETATLQLRAKRDSLSLIEFCSRLNFYGNTPFAELSGVLPSPTSGTGLYEGKGHNYTWSAGGGEGDSSSASVYRHDVIRGFVGVAELTRVAGASPITRFFSSIECPLPTSFPSFFRSPLFNDRAWHTPTGILTKPRSAPVVSSLGLRTDGLPALLERYASFAEDCVKGRVDFRALGIDRDDAAELSSSIWAVRDNFGSHQLAVDDMDDS